MAVRIVVIGTGTGVGKTHLALSLVQALAAGGTLVAGLKPIESGVAPGVLTDAAQLAGAGTFHVKHPPPYALRLPVSPHLAARAEGTSINLDPIAAWVDTVAAAVAVIETAGGLLSPLGPGLTNLDLARRLAPDHLVLVAPDRLGVLHDVTACMVALRHLSPELPEPLVSLMAPETPDASTGSNAAELQTLSIASRVVSFPRCPSGSMEALSAARAALGRLGYVSRETTDPPG